MLSRPFPVLVALILALAPLPKPALASWPRDPSTNLPLCTASGTQNEVGITADGAGGAIVGWFDTRSGNADVYVQRVTLAGARTWAPDGLPVAAGPGSQSRVVLCADGAGGAFLAWTDSTTGDGAGDLFAQRVGASGSPMWGAAGVPLCTAPGAQSFKRCVPDGSGGAFFVWADRRGGSSYDLYAQRLDATGAPQWGANGVAACTATGDQVWPWPIADGQGGVIVVWYDDRNGSANSDVYAQRLNGAGVPSWTANGVAVCNASGEQESPVLCSDGAGGAIITWDDTRATIYAPYAQRVSAGGAPLWTANGVLLGGGVTPVYDPHLVADGFGGAIISLVTNAPGATDLLAQRLDANGNALWTPGGVTVSVAPGDQFGPGLVSDGAGGAVITWHDYRADLAGDIYSQRLDALGNPQWAPNGVALGIAPGTQPWWWPRMVPDGTGGAVAAWNDGRSGAPGIYAQRVSGDGTLGGREPGIANAGDVPGDQGGRVLVLWDASDADTLPAPDVESYALWRRVIAGAAAARQARDLDAPWSGAGPDRGALGFTVENGQATYWEFLVTVPAFGETGYGYTATTATDSTPAQVPWNVFMVTAKQTGQAVWWRSAPDSGYSVDNLAPAPPAPFIGAYAAGATALHWGASREADFAEYRLHHGTTADFVPGPGSLLAAQPDTGYLDPGPAGSFYKLCAVDLHGNASGYATLGPSGTTDTPRDGAQEAIALGPPIPNPACGSVVLRYAVPRPGVVSLAVFDIAGRRVRSLVRGAVAAGEHRTAWDARDDTGKSAPAGLYLVRLEAEGPCLTRRLLLTR